MESDMDPEPPADVPCRPAYSLPRPALRRPRGWGVISATPLPLPRQPHKTPWPGRRGWCTHPLQRRAGSEAGALHLPRLENLRRFQGKRLFPQICPHPAAEA